MIWEAGLQAVHIGRNALWLYMHDLYRQAILANDKVSGLHLHGDLLKKVDEAGSAITMPKPPYPE